MIVLFFSHFLEETKKVRMMCSITLLLKETEIKVTPFFQCIQLHLNLLMILPSMHTLITNHQAFFPRLHSFLYISPIVQAFQVYPISL